MTRQWDPAGDRDLAAVLHGANVPLDGDSFVAAVMGRVQRRIFIRRCVLGAAAALGLAIAYDPLADLAAQLAAAIQVAPTLVTDREWLAARSRWLALLVMPLVWPLVRWLAR